MAIENISEGELNLLKELRKLPLNKDTRYLITIKIRNNLWSIVERVTERRIISSKNQGDNKR